jgi:hypothetical protein
LILAPTGTGFVVWKVIVRSVTILTVVYDLSATALSTRFGVSGVTEPVEELSIEYIPTND